MGLFVVFHSFFGFFGSLHKIHTICFCESFIKQMCSRGCFLEPLVRCFGKKPSFSVFCGDWFRVLMLSSMDRLKLKCKGFFCVRETYFMLISILGIGFFLFASIDILSKQLALTIVLAYISIAVSLVAVLGTGLFQFFLVHM